MVSVRPVMVATPEPRSDRLFLVLFPRPVRAPQPVPYLDRVEPVERVHENAARVRCVRVSCHAQPARLTDLAQVPADHVVADAVPPFDHLSWADAQCQPVPGQRDGLLAQDHQEVIPGELPPGAVRVGGVVLGDSDEVQPARPGSGRQLLRRQLAALRARGMNMAVTPVPAAPPASRTPRRELRRPDLIRHLGLPDHPTPSSAPYSLAPEQADRGHTSRTADPAPACQTPPLGLPPAT